jgi:hypothetical protein
VSPACFACDHLGRHDDHLTLDNKMTPDKIDHNQHLARTGCLRETDPGDTRTLLNERNTSQC